MTCTTSPAATGCSSPRCSSCRLGLRPDPFRLSLVGSETQPTFSLVAALRKAQPEPNEDEKAAQAQHVAAALATLRQSIAAGYSDFKHMATDPDLAPLRDREDFQKLVADLEAGKK